ncbi:MAG: glycoside hydrolase family 2 TIM barrel-domain containing protein, partial [bacterium]|nr:glycoside hydrolase family 2 TIM barrel-domain containing protein [bacterium]
MPRKSICLNGEWQFQPDSGSLQYPPSVNWAKTKIRIPSPWNVNSFYPEKGGDFRWYPSYPKEWEPATAGWHRREFVVPQNWNGSTIALHFEGIHYYCEIYVNGTLIGTHEDGFVPFEIDITDKVKFGQKNELIIGVKSFVFYNRLTPPCLSRLRGNDTPAKAGVAGVTCPTGSFWGMTVSGIWLDVFLVAYPRVKLDDIYIQTSVRKKRITITTTIKNETAQLQKIILTQTIRGWQQFRIPVTIATKTQKTVTLTRPWTNPNLWHPEHPKLYLLHTTLETDTGMNDQLTTRFGFREFWIDKNTFILNSTPIKLRGDAWHYLGIGYQNPKYAKLWYQLAKQSNLNHIRLHAQIYPRYYLDLADEMGILITDETAIWASHCAYHYNPDFWRRTKDQVTALVKRDRNHPSVIIWSVENEALAAYTFVQDDAIKSNDDLAAQFYELVKVMHALDTTRPISADGSFDLGGRAEIYNIHYPPLPRLKDKVNGKPITVGEMGSLYYSTPDEVSVLHGESTYFSFSERLKAVAQEQERMIFYVREWANQVSPFNTVWYSMEPLPFSGKSIEEQRSDTPGPKPERIGPYSATLNPGYDKSLPKWKPNAIYPYLQKLLLPVRFYLHEQEKSYFANTKYFQTLTIHNDSYHQKNLELIWSAKIGRTKLVASGKKEFSLEPASNVKEQIAFNLPAVMKRTSVVLHLQLKENRKILYQEKRTFDIVPKPVRFKLPTRPQLAGVKDAQWYLLPPNSNLAPDEITYLKTAVQRGLRVVCLENNESFHNSLGYVSLEKGTYDRAFVQPTLRPILRDIRNTDLQFWGKDGLVAHSNFANFPKGNFRPYINLGNGKPMLIELIDGEGAYFITTLELSKYLESEPGAELLYRNLVDYANLPSSYFFTTTTLIGEPNKTLNIFLDYLGVEYNLQQNLNQNKSSAIIVDGSISPDKSTIKMLSGFLQQWGIVILWGLIPETITS